MTGRPSRDKGNRAERAVVRWLRDLGYRDARRSGSGFPGSDVLGILGVTVEIKNRRKLELAGWIDQMTDALDADNNDVGLVIHKRPGKPDPADWYVTTTGAIAARLLADAGYSQGEPIK